MSTTRPLLRSAAVVASLIGGSLHFAIVLAAVNTLNAEGSFTNSFARLALFTTLGALGYGSALVAVQTGSARVLNVALSVGIALIGLLLLTPISGAWIVEM